MMIPFWGQFYSAYSTSWTRPSLNPSRCCSKWEIADLLKMDLWVAMRGKLTLKHQCDGGARMIYCPQRCTSTLDVCENIMPWQWMVGDGSRLLIDGCLCQVLAIRKSSRRESQKPFQGSVTSLNSSSKRCNLAFAFHSSPSAWHKHII